VFFCADGHRHWVMDAEWLAEHGFRWPDDVQDVPASVLEAFRPGRNAPRQWSAADRATPRATNVLAMREIMLSGLTGQGLEFGAGAAPMPVPLACRMRYADVFTIEQIRASFYEGQTLEDLVVPDLVASFEEFEGVPAYSLDFIVSSHVIEHTSDPIGALIRGATKLRPGGSIALAVPDMNRTFDCDRPVTPLAHLIADFEAPSRARDEENFREFYSLAFPEPPDAFEQVWRQKWAERFPIHYHCWTYESFGEMITWIQEQHGTFRDVWSYHPTEIADAIEFYWLLTVA
jgi:SAM-dependent methyltransferase